MPGLLDLLTESWQSGEALAERLGVSRAAVSKEARRLRAEGYPVEVSRRGYRILPGTPLPHLQKFSQRICMICKSGPGRSDLSNCFSSLQCSYATAPGYNMPP